MAYATYRIECIGADAREVYRLIEESIARYEVAGDEQYLIEAGEYEERLLDMIERERVR